MLKYKGNGFIPGIPARNLSTKEVEKYGGEALLVASGIYTTGKVVQNTVQKTAPKKEQKSKSKKAWFEK